MTRYSLVNGDVVMAPSHAGECIAYPVRQADGSLSLCVIEGGAFHNFSISRCCLGRLVAEGAEIFWAEERAAIRNAPPIAEIGQGRTTVMARENSAAKG